MLKEIGLVVTGVVIGTAGTLYLTRELLGGAIAEKLIGVMEEIIDEEVQDVKDEIYNEQVEKDNKRDYSKVLRKSGGYPWGDSYGTKTPTEYLSDNRKEALEVLDKMIDIVGEYGLVTLAEYYKLIGVEPEVSEYRYGWADLSSAMVLPSISGFFIKLPKATLINR